MKRFLIVTIIAVIFTVITVAQAAACEMSFSVTPVGGSSESVSPDSPIRLIEGQDYVLRMEYYEDHRNCSTKPEETLFLLEGSRWRKDKVGQPLILTESVVWTMPKNRTNVGELVFTAAETCTFRLEIIRECTREGYHGELEFVVS